MENDQNLIETDLIIDTSIYAHLKETAGWGKFLSIVGFIYSGLVAMGAIFAASMLSRLTGSYSANTHTNSITAVAVGIVYLGLAGVVFFMSMFLFRFAKNTQIAIKTNDQEALNDSFKNLKIYFRFAGIITVIAIILTVLMVVAVMMAAAFSRG